MRRILDDSSGGVLAGRVWAKGSSGIRASVRLFAETALFLEIFAFAATVPYLLRLKLPRLARVLEWGNSRSVSAAPKDHVRKITSYVELAINRGRPIVRAGCLTRGLTRYYFFRRAGVDVSLCFGMGRRNEEFMGHCWLVENGEPFLEVEDPRPLYAEVYRIPRTGGQAEAPSGADQERRFSEA